MEKKKILLLMVLGICVLSFIPAVLGATNEKIRSLDEWGELNYSFGYWYAGNRILFFDDWYDNPQVTFDGFILEKEISDGSLDVRVNLYVHNLPCIIGEFRLIGDEYQLFWIFEGVGEFHYFNHFTMDDGDYGIQLPNIYDIWDGFFYENGLHWLGEHFVGYGPGDYYEDDISTSDPVPAKFSLKGLGIAIANLPDDHPLRGFAPVIWAGEFIEIHTIK
ncbi:MAG: hypothetical protein ACFFCY_10285 [Promethearchaeota archaeon]